MPAKGMKKCPECDGVGECGFCQGTGEYHPGSNKKNDPGCPHCNDGECAECNGTRWVTTATFKQWADRHLPETTKRG